MWRARFGSGSATSCAAGSIVLVCAPPVHDEATPHLALAAMLAPSGLVRPMVAKPEKAALLVQLEQGGEGSATGAEGVAPMDVA